MAEMKIVRAKGLIRCIYQGCCPSLNEGSRLHYEVGERYSDNTLHVRIVENARSGTYHDDWLCGESIKYTLSGKSGLTGAYLNKLLDSGDKNIGGFLLAVLKDIGLVCKENSTYLDQVDFKNLVENLVKEQKEQKENFAK